MFEKGTWVRVLAPRNWHGSIGVSQGPLIEKDGTVGAFFVVTLFIVKDLNGVPGRDYLFFPRELEVIDEEDVPMYLIAGIGT